MLSYTGWNLWGNVASVMSGQGVNVLLNIFFGPSVNAARAIAMQVSGALNSFVQNLQVAINPQIIKSYAADDMTYMHRLVCYGAKYNFFVLFVLSMPVLINTKLILKTWLGTVPEYTAIFLQLIIVNILIDSISAPLMTSAQATGRIRLYQSVVGGILLLNVPLSYLLLKLGSEPHIVIFAGIISSILAFLARLVILKKLTSLPVKLFLQEVVMRSLLIVGTVWSTYHFTLSQNSEALGFWLSSTLTTVFVLSTILVLGFDHRERSFIYQKLNYFYQALK